jgi:hypothetical protein
MGSRYSATDKVAASYAIGDMLGNQIIKLTN